MASGYVKLHREAEDHPVFDDPWLWKVFCWCVMRANFKDGKVPRGSFTTGRIEAADRLNVSPSRVYRAFGRLAALGCITLKSNNRFTTVTICNYGTYQSDDPLERTADEQPSGQPADTTGGHNRRTLLEEGKEGKEGKKDSIVVYESAEFLAAWNSAPGVVPARRIAGNRQKHLAARSRDSTWDWRAALAKFPLKLFASEPDGWQPNIDWFLKPDTVSKILEGTYDWSKSNGSKPNHVGPGQRYDGT